VTSQTAGRFEFPFALRALQARNFRLFFSGQVVSLTGSWITSTANFWLIYELTGRNIFLGLSAFCAQIPALFLAPLAGVLVDRWDLRRTLLLTQSCSATQSLLLAVLAWTGIVTGMPLVFAILALQLLQGIINSFDLPARQSFSIQMVDRREDLPNAIALNSMIVNLSRFVGPGLGGILLAVGAARGSLLIGPALCYTVDACSYLAVLIALYCIRPRPIERTPRGGRYFTELRAGISYIRHHRALRTVLISMFATSFFGVAFNTQLASIAKSHLGVGPQGYGYLFASVGVGATVSAVFLATRRTTASLPRLISYASVMLAGSIIALSLTTNYTLALLLTGLMGLAMILQSASTNTLCQTLAGDQMRGRVMSFFTMSFMGTVPLGAVVVGQMMELIGMPWTMRVCAGGLLLVSCFTGPILRRAVVGGVGPSDITP
jgi:MFS family permease